MHGMIFSWTAERVATLRTMFDQKHSAGDIAAVFGVTRNTVVGKLARLGLKRGYTRKHAGQDGQHKQRQRKVRAVPFELRPKRGRPPKISLPPLPLPEPEKIACNPVPLLELQPGQCRFEVSGSDNVAEYVFCANATVGEKSFCCDHMRIAYR